MNANENVTATFNPPPDFTLSPASAQLSLSAGGQATDPAFTSQSGFAGIIALTCSVSGGPPAPTCGISPNMVNAGGSATLTVNASGIASLSLPPQFGRPGALWAVLLPFAFLLWSASRGTENRRRQLYAASGLVLLAALFQAACGGGAAPQLPKNFTVTVTANSGQITKLAQIKVTVN